jgi:Alginate export
MSLLRPTRFALFAGLLCMEVFGRTAGADSVQPLTDALLDSKPLADIRLRYEDVQQVPFEISAVALTLRARLGVETGSAWGTSFLVEGNFLAPLIDNYRSDNAVVADTKYPIVPDPRDTALNRLQLTNKSLPDTTISLGRQRINLDDQRFIGSANWRQDEQTFDAVRVVNQSIANLTFDFSYLDKIHRVYGPNSPQGTYTGDFYLGNVSYKTPIGKLTGFAYLLTFDPLKSFPGLAPAPAAALNPVRQSTETVGGRFSDQRKVQSFGWGYVFSYANQKQRGDNPLVFSNDYWLAELSGSFHALTATIGDERMDGNGTIGFSTPLATTHAFDGWADKFLTTPANGLDNRYGTLSYEVRPWGPFNSLSAMVTYRSFAAPHVSANYGSEWDFRVAAKWQRLTTSVFYADYSASAATPITVARDTRKLWLQCDFIW